MRLSHEKAMLGGVGNVASNIAALDGEAVLVATIGADDGGADSRRTSRPA